MQSRSRVNPHPSKVSYGTQFAQNFPSGSNVVPYPLFFMLPDNYYASMGGHFRMPPPGHVFSPPPQLNILSRESQHVDFGVSGSDKEPTTPMSRLGPHIFTTIDATRDVKYYYRGWWGVCERK